MLTFPTERVEGLGFASRARWSWVRVRFAWAAMALAALLLTPATGLAAGVASGESVRPAERQPLDVDASGSADYFDLAAILGGSAEVLAALRVGEPVHALECGRSVRLIAMLFGHASAGGPVLSAPEDRSPTASSGLSAAAPAPAPTRVLEHAAASSYPRLAQADPRSCSLRPLSAGRVLVFESFDPACPRGPPSAG